MYGLIFEVLEEFVVDEFGLKVWHRIKEKAGYKRKDNGYLRRAFYEDQELVDLITAASSILKVSFNDIIEGYGRYFIIHAFQNGYGELLKCQGSTLRQWLSNLNAMHDYVKRSFPGDKFIAPVFWCEDCEDCEDGAILLHYYSMRGTIFVPLVVGIVEELASYRFDMKVKLKQLALQGEGGATFTTWRISAVEEPKKFTLTPMRSSNIIDPPNFEGIVMPSVCPFSGRALDGGISTASEKDELTTSHPVRPSISSRRGSVSSRRGSVSSRASSRCPFQNRRSSILESEIDITNSFDGTDDTASADFSLAENADEIRFRLKHLNELFPFHIIVDKDFMIISVGEKLPELLKKPLQQIKGWHIGDIVEITRPILTSKCTWNWKSLNKLADQNFFLCPKTKTSTLRKKVSMEESPVQFMASMYGLSSKQVLFTLAPYARTVKELNRMGLTLSDLPLSSFQRDAVFLGEHVAKEASRAHKLDKLTKELAERDLSNMLLESMLPKKVAEDLRQGKTVEPAFHDKVTLFFSDVVGFTSICNQVEPWDVIDMMNKLYTVMDFLASHFDLYKVETVGDAYMCCCGLPEPDELHAEKVANFALAVMECVKHVKSPVDGSPIQLRIGIHTGSCTSGVVGTLTPHYALFGDMVNTASRHESTGIPGKIQCSSVLYDRLQYSSPMDSPQFNFKPRGLVDMKGKGECYTYWLESATECNNSANTGAVESLSSRVEDMLAMNTWKKRSYFEDSAHWSLDPEDTMRSDESVTSRPYDAPGMESFNHSVEFFDETNEPDEIPAFASQSVNETSSHKWASLRAESSTRGEMETAIFVALSDSLMSCIQKKGNRIETIQEQLRDFVSTVGNMYTEKAQGHELEDVSDLIARANFLWEAKAPNQKSPYALGVSPWDHFVLLFSAFIHRVKHTGCSNATLVSKQHIVAQMYEGLQSCQQRRSVDFTFTLLIEQFGDLYEEIIFGCPNFRHKVHKAVLSTDLESENAVHSMLQKCEYLIMLESLDERKARERNHANIGLILAVATVGQYTQSLDRFLQRSAYQFDQFAKSDEGNHEVMRGESWYYEQSMFLKDVVRPLIEQVSPVLPLATYLKGGVSENISFWDKRGKEWIAANTLKVAKVEETVEGIPVSRFQVEELVTLDVEILETALMHVVVARNGSKHTLLADEAEATAIIPYDEIQMFVEMKKKPTIAVGDAQRMLYLDADVRSELRDFVVTIVSGYENNRFHNFLHASHVTHLANLLLKGIHSKDEESAAYGLANDPLARFAIVLSALVHDVGHTGVPNAQLAEEQPELADKYRSKSIAEQNSVDTAWNILMSRKFLKLQQCLFESKEEKRRFRKLLVNCVMATDIFDKELRELRQSRWNKVFCDNGSLNSSEEEAHYKATIVMEHIMQASDVAHTMQDWEIYREWNESLFQEMYEAYTDGRSPKDPSDGWYEGELWFFDNWVIPLAQNLKECGVLDIVSDQLLKQAQSDRQRWVVEGQEICKTLRDDFVTIRSLQGFTSRRPSSMSAASTSSSSASHLASQMVAEAESSSKLIARYERKYETALGNLIALAYKGRPCPIDLEKQELADVHDHLKKQDWYRFHSHDEQRDHRVSVSNNFRL